MTAANALAPTVGWTLVCVGPLLAAAAYLVVRYRRSSTKLGAGAAAVVALAWFVITADWLPPGWADFWDTHDISAGLITSVLGVVAGWVFLDERLAKRRLAALHTTWQQWLDQQHAFLHALLDDAPHPGASLGAQHMRASDLLARLMIQQQWTATMFTITAMRADEGGIDLIPAIGKLRDVGTDAIREFARLEAVLNRASDENLDQHQIDVLWKAPLFHLKRLAETLEALRNGIRSELWNAHEEGGQKPTHRPVDVETLRVSRVSPFTTS